MYPNMLNKTTRPTRKQALIYVHKWEKMLRLWECCYNNVTVWPSD